MAGGGAYGVAPWGVDLDTVFSRSQGAGQGLSQGLNLSQKQSLAMAQPGRGMQLLSQEISPPVAGKPAGVGAGAGRKAAGQGHSKGPRAQVAGGDAVYGVVGLNGAAGGDGSAKKGKKPYVPKVETANYAFLIVMYQVGWAKADLHRCV